MGYEAWLGTEENRELLAVCARKVIHNSGIAAIVWGAINIISAAIMMFFNFPSIVLLFVGIMMLASGVRAIRKPSLAALRVEVIVSIILLPAWYATPWRYVPGIPRWHDVVFPAMIAAMLINYYAKLWRIRGQVESVAPENIEPLQQRYKTLQQKKLKEEPEIVQGSNRCRAQLMGDQAFFVQTGDIPKAFVASRREVRACLVKPDAEKLSLKIRHPIGLLTCVFDKKNSEKLHNWLAAESAQAATLPPAQPV